MAGDRVAHAPADLHVHSSASDGSDAPATLGPLAAAAGLSTFALTDHDTTRGWESAAAGLPAGVTMVPGAELSCRVATAGGTISMHLLAYLFDRTEPAFAAVRHRLRNARLERIDGWAHRLRADGHGVSLDGLREQALSGVVGKPALVDLLLAEGLVPDRETGFGPEWAGGRYRVPRWQWDVLDAIPAVRAAGGVSVFAHPLARLRGPVVTLDDIVRLAAAGLGGVEVDHPDHAPADRSALRSFARKHGLLALGSSDYHGTAKTQRLGAETTARPVLDNLLVAGTGCAPMQAAAAHAGPAASADPAAAAAAPGVGRSRPAA